ncbi:hypothetical protein J6590_026253 [Homalodisca vitripennis]|nr:hypothetical protein J6590_026253 [Homalodisca vitripennis]
MAPMEDVWSVLTNCMTHKVQCLGEPRYLGHKLSYREEITQRSTRKDRKFHFLKCGFRSGGEASATLAQPCIMTSLTLPSHLVEVEDILDSYSVHRFRKIAEITGTGESASGVENERGLSIGEGGW